MCTYSAINIWLSHGWCHVQLLPSRRMFCVHDGGDDDKDDDDDDDDGDDDCDDDSDDLNRAVLFRYLHAVILCTLLQSHTLSVS